MTTEEKIKLNAPEGAKWYTPNSTLYVRENNNGNVEVCRFGETYWTEIPMKLDECYLKPL